MALMAVSFYWPATGKPSCENPKVLIELNTEIENQILNLEQKLSGLLSAELAQTPDFKSSDKFQLEELISSLDEQRASIYVPHLKQTLDNFKKLDSVYNEFLLNQSAVEQSAAVEITENFAYVRYIVTSKLLELLTGAPSPRFIETFEDKFNTNYGGLEEELSRQNIKNCANAEQNQKNTEALEENRKGVSQKNRDNPWPVAEDNAPNQSCLTQLKYLNGQGEVDEALATRFNQIIKYGKSEAKTEKKTPFEALSDDQELKKLTERLRYFKALKNCLIEQSRVSAINNDAWEEVFTDLYETLRDNINNEELAESIDLVEYICQNQTKQIGCWD